MYGSEQTLECARHGVMREFFNWVSRGARYRNEARKKKYRNAAKTIRSNNWKTAQKLFRE